MSSWERVRTAAAAASAAGDFVRAAELFAEARVRLERSFQPGDEQARVALLDMAIDEGRALTFAARLEEAVSLLERACAAASSELGGLHAVTVRAGLAVGAALFRLGRIEAAATYWFACEAALAAGAEAQEDVRATLHNNLGGVYYHRGEHERAIACFERSIVIYEQCAGTEHKDLARPLTNLAWLASLAGRPIDAERYARRALATGQRTRSPRDPELAPLMQTLAIVLTDQDRLGEAAELYEHALELVAVEDPLRACALANLADLYRDLGDVSLAHAFAHEASAVASASIDAGDPVHGGIMRTRALTALAAGDLEDARAATARALALEHHEPGTAIEARTENRLVAAEVALAGGDTETALTSAREGLNLLAGEPSVRLPVIEARLRYAVARAATRLGRIAEALEALAAAEELTRPTGSVGTAFHHDILEARVAAAEHSGDAAAVMQAANAAVAALGRMRAEEFALLDTAGRVRRSARGLIWFDRVLARPLLDDALRHEHVEAWFCHHHAASTALAAMVRWSDQAEAPARAAAASYRATLRALSLKATGPSDNDCDALRVRLASLERNSGRAQVDAMARALGPLRLSDVAELLGEDEAMTAVAWLVSRAVVIAVRPDGSARVTQAGPTPALVGDVRRLRTCLQDGASVDLGLARPLAEALIDRELLLQPSLKRLIVVPDGAAALLPWGIIVDAVRSHCGRAPVEVIQTPSARSFVDARRRVRGPVAATASCVIADPDFGARAISHAYRGAEFTAATTSAAYRDWLAGLRLPRLHHSRDEATAVSAYDAGCQALVGRHATVDALLSLRRPRVLHVATHGFVYPGPDDIGLALLRPVLALAGARATASTVPGERPPAMVGFLPALAMASMDLDGTELVMLSACDSSLGSTLPGEGLAGMPQALLMAGARSVIATLWRVADHTAADVARDFYRHLAMGATPVQALQRTQRDAGHRGTANAYVCWA
jgi:tetratricopeptide (TPR) repeat protein